MNAVQIMEVRKECSFLFEQTATAGEILSISTLNHVANRPSKGTVHRVSLSKSYTNYVTTNREQ
jgi:hypothetical protein